MTDLQKRTIQAIVNVFETGRIRGNYGAVTAMAGDSGHLTYGRSQTTLGSGNLYTLLNGYCSADGAQFADQIRPFLGRVQAKDFTLDQDAAFRAVLRQAGADPVMQSQQDDFFERGFFVPAMNTAASSNITTVLGQAVVYDSRIQGAWGVVRDIVVNQSGRISDALNERDWIGLYVKARKRWLQSRPAPLPITAYRMDAFQSIIDAGNWDLDLPLTVHGVQITAAALGSAGAEAATSGS